MSGSPVSSLQTRWGRGLIWAGLAALVLSLLCLVASVIGMIWTFDAIATSTGAPKPADLATGISNSLGLSIAVVPLAILGISLLMVGVIRRS